MTLEDFKNYKALVKKPVITQLDENFQMLTQPLPSSGILAAFLIKLMRGTFSFFYRFNFLKINF